MSQQESTSQDSTGTQEIYSEESFEEIWQTLGRTFSNPEKLVQGVVSSIPLEIEYADAPERDNIEITYQHRTMVCQPSSPITSPGLSNYSQLAQFDPQTLTMSNGHDSSMVNGVHPTAVPSPVLIQNSCVYQPVQLPPNLPTKSFPGNYNFRIEFEPNTSPITKATPWVYNAKEQKLFVKMQCVCPIIFRIQGDPPPASVVRGILMYKRPEHYNDNVIRCPNHKNTCKDGHQFQDHVMRCENRHTVYESCPKTKRLSLFIPLSATDPVEGENYFKELFKFTCFNSCVGGMNRRPTYLLFRLECGGVVSGRAVVEVRICASPGRDSTEKETGTLQKNSKDSDKRNSNEPSSTTDVITPLQFSTTRSPALSPTSTYPPRASVLWSAKKDSSCAPEPFQFPSHQSTVVKRACPVATDGVIVGQAKRFCSAESADDEVFTLTFRGRERFEMFQKLNHGLDVLEGLVTPEEIWRNAGNEVRSAANFTKILQKVPPDIIKKEKTDSTQCDVANVSPQSSQETASQEGTPLSRTSSNASSQSSTTQNVSKIHAWQVTMKRTVSLEKPSRSKTT